MLEQCDFMELTEEVLLQCKGFTCKDEDITEFFTQDYADYAYQLLGKSYCFVKPETSEIVAYLHSSVDEVIQRCSIAYT